MLFDALLKFCEVLILLKNERGGEVCFGKSMVEHLHYDNKILLKESQSDQILIVKLSKHCTFLDEIERWVRATRRRYHPLPPLLILLRRQAASLRPRMQDSAKKAETDLIVARLKLHFKGTVNFYFAAKDSRNG